MDEPYVGDRYDERRKRGRYNKEVLVGVVERETGRVHANAPGAFRSHRQGGNAQSRQFQAHL
jgi:hypothetical protein